MLILCPNCDDSNKNKVIRFGVRDGKQRYKCKSCGYRFQENSTLRKIDTYFRAKAVQLYLEGLSHRGISGLLAVHETTVSRWLEPYEEILSPLIQEKDTKKLELISQSPVIVTQSLTQGKTSGILFIGEDSTELWGVSRFRKNVSREQEPV